MSIDVEGMDLDALEKVARIVPTWADTTWELDRDASTDAFEVRVALDGDVDGDTGRHLITGGDLVALMPDVLGDGDLAKFITTFDPPTVLRLLAALRAQAERVRVLEGERDEALDRCGKLELAALGDHGKICAVTARAEAAERRAGELEGDANRWRALMRCGRIQMQGSSGVDPHTGERNGNNVHFGAEFWPERHDKFPELIEGHDRSTAWGKACLVALADAIMEQEADRALLPATQAEGEK